MKQTTLIISVLQKLRRVLPQGAPDLDNQEVAEAWAEVLQDIPADVLVKVVREASFTSDFFPSVAKLRAAAKGIEISQKEEKAE